MWDKHPFASQDFCSLRDAGPVTDTQLGFVAVGNDGGGPGTHVEQIVLDAPMLLLAPERLRAAWQELAKRHEALRMILRADETGMSVCSFRPSPWWICGGWTGRTCHEWMVWIRNRRHFLPRIRTRGRTLQMAPAGV